MLRELQVHHARLHHGALVLDVDFENAVHAREGDHDATLLRNRAAAKSGAGAARHHGNVLGGGQPHDLGNLFGVLRKDNSAGRALADARVILVQHEVFGAVQDGIASGDLAEMIDKAGQVHRQV